MFKKILIVDDDKQVTEGVGTFLKGLGHDMLLALDGKTAMDIIKKEKPALVLLDIQLPKVNGIEILTRLRKDFKGIKVFVITAYAKDVKSKCDDLGYDRFFAKPIELDPLLEGISEVIQGEKREEKKPLKGTPKAKILFVEPDAIVSAYMCALFYSKEFCEADYEKKEIRDYGKILDTLYEYEPDVVVIYDGYIEVKHLGELIAGSSHKPKIVILHGLLPKSLGDIMDLKKQGIIYCNQYSWTTTELKKVNRKLIEIVGQECLKKNLVKK